MSPKRRAQRDELDKLIDELAKRPPVPGWQNFMGALIGIFLGPLPIVLLGWLAFGERVALILAFVFTVLGIIAYRWASDFLHRVELARRGVTDSD